MVPQKLRKDSKNYTLNCIYLCSPAGPHSAHIQWAAQIQKQYGGRTVPAKLLNTVVLFSTSKTNFIVAEGVRPIILAIIYKLSRIREVKILSIAHGYPLGVKTLTFKDKIIRYFYRKSDGIIAVSWLQKDFIINHFKILNVPIKVCYPFVDVEDFLPIYPNLASNCNIVFVGALEKIKGADLLSHILTEIRKVFPTVELYVIGKGALFEKLKQEEKRVTGLHVLGWQSKEQIKKIFLNSKILLAPSRADTFCVPVLEAMASGIIPIVTHMVGAKIFVQKLDSKLVVQIDTNSIVDKALELLKEDSNKITTLSLNAKKIAAQWDSKTSQETVHKTYEYFAWH